MSPLLAEAKVEFTRELSALVARTPDGEARAWPVVHTIQVDGVCDEVIAPALDIPVEVAAAAEDAALRIAAELDVTGVLAVELFETPGTGAGFLINELAMRPHNTGHWTQDGSITSQFEQHLRAVLNLPLGATWTCIQPSPWPWPANLPPRSTATASPFGPAARSATSTWWEVRRRMSTQCAGGRLRWQPSSGTDAPAQRNRQ
jgi:hypothetical protein